MDPLKTDPSYTLVAACILSLPCRQQNTGKLVWRLVYRISFFKDAGAPDEKGSDLRPQLRSIVDG